MANLEEIEQKCLQHLKEVHNPLVSVPALLGHLHNEGLDATEPELINFLRNHDLFRVLESAALAELAPEVRELEASGLISRQYAILDTRIPTERQVMVRMYEELERLTGAMTTALKELEAAADSEKATRVQAVLDRAKRIQEELKAKKGL